ncbi:MAG TPA: NADP-dependent oxidoreductase [Acidimicrobiales bacterium]|nr:NADP-dependent oxidoreductase [Acidimicrobiales bacterium]
MRVVGVETFGGPEVLRVFEVPEPLAGPGEVRIRVHAATVNPADVGFRAGAYGDRLTEGRRPPYVPGMEAAGVVDQVGEGVTGVAVGDQVMAIVLPTGPHGGAYAEKVVVPARSVVAQPRGVGHAAAATLPMNGLTARMALDLLALQAGSTLAVTGAAGAVGGYTVQLAKAEGLRVVADASASDQDLVRSLGADIVVARGGDVAARIREVAPEGVEGLVDAAVLGARVLPAVRDGGSVACVRAFDGEPERGITIHQVLVARYATEREKLDSLRQQAEDGVLTLRVARTFPPEQAAEAHRQLEAGGTRGRLVLEL